MSQRNRIEIYSREDFQGYKYTFETQNKTKLNKCVLNISNVSIKVFGNGRWRISGGGKHIDLGKGMYPRMDVDIRGIRNIESVQPVVQASAASIPPSKIYEDPWAALGAWFLGPKAENIDFFTEQAEKLIHMHAEYRNMYFPTDPIIVGDELKKNDACKQERLQTKMELTAICKELQASIPWGSTRYQAHQTADVSIQAFLGYMSGLMYNPNNQASEGSPVTTKMEIEVGQQLCEMMGYGGAGMPTPWGHITCDGSVANLEALWSSRNVRLYPLSVQNGLKDPRMALAANYMVYVPGAKADKKLSECTTWECLNLDMSTILAMPQEVTNMAQVDDATYSDAVDSTNITNLGFAEFISTFELESIPKVVASMSKHYSWTKAASVLGFGEKNIVGIPFDANGRMDTGVLRTELEKLRLAQTPVISVVVVMGATETSAVDDLEDVLTVREEFRDKGLTFAINADGAWGGYFCSVLHEPPASSPHRSGSALVPNFPVDPHTLKQLKVMKQADTITADPHKTGFAPYPAGALCYRDEAMKGFVMMQANYIINSSENPEIGFWGIEGSKPGAAAVGVLLSHRTIGLDNYGIGRILGQCTFGAKILYCVWLTLAEDDDNFVCVPMKPPPTIPGKTLSDIKQFIRTRILWKTNQELLTDDEVLDFLEVIGPDMLITAFGFNKTGNTDISVCNDIIVKIAERCTNTSPFYDIRRVEIFLTKSTFPPDLYGTAESQFKDRLGLDKTDTTPLSYLLNTNTNPWTTVNMGAFYLGQAVRQATLNAIGEVFDTATKHYFVSSSHIASDGSVFVDYLPKFNYRDHQYHVVTKLQFLDTDAVMQIKQLQSQNSLMIPIIYGCESVEKLEDFLHDAMKNERSFSVWVGTPSATNPPVMTGKKVKVLDTPRDKHFDLALTAYPETMTYFLYGEGNSAYLSHNIGKSPNFQQVVALDRVPYDVSRELLQLGINITIPGMSGTPPKDGSGHIIDPLVDTEYKIEFRTYDGHTMASTMFLKNLGAKVYFDSTDINTP